MKNNISELNRYYYSEEIKDNSINKKFFKKINTYEESTSD